MCCLPVLRYCAPSRHPAAAIVRSGLVKSPPQSSIWPILENYGCRWIERVIKILYEWGGPPDVIELLITLSSKFFQCAIGPSNSLLFCR